MATAVLLPARQREDIAARAGSDAAAILAAAERGILAAMASAGTLAIRGTIGPQLARRKVSLAAAVELGRASSSLAGVYSRTAQQATGKDVPLPDAPGQVARAILTARQDADVAFGAVLAAALGSGNGVRIPPPSSPYRRITDKAARQGAPGKAAAAALGAIQARGLTGYVTPAGRRQPLAAYAGRAVRVATSALARQPVMGEVTARRQQLAASHVAAVNAAWNQAVQGLDASGAVAAYRADSRVSGGGQQQPGLLKRWRTEAARAAAFEFLSRIYRSGRYAALVAALEQAVREGMAEGEADALALAAYRQGLGSFDIDAAFRAALARLQGDARVTSAALDALSAMIGGATADAARELAAPAPETLEEQVARAVAARIGGEDVAAVRRWTEEALWEAFGSGAVGLYRKAMGQFTGQGVELDWITDSSPCAVCAANRDGSPYTPYDVPSLPQHFHCRCDIISDTRLPVTLMAPFLVTA
jgi:hypothetical protein